MVLCLCCTLDCWAVCFEFIPGLGDAAHDLSFSWRIFPCIIKVRVTAEEKLRIAYACKELHLTQSELVRRVLYGVNVKHTVVVAQGGEDVLAALAALSAQCSKVGSNLNQLARHLNSGGKDTEQLRAQILEELSALTNFRLKAEETVGELYGNHQAFDLEKL